MADNKENALKNINLKYNCPICFRYFNRNLYLSYKGILKTSCCKNYVCLHCTNDMNKSYFYIDF
jgi:hypothetical protein